MWKNEPYKKIYENGVLTNPITKDKPYVQMAREDKKKMRLSKNGKGFELVVAKIGATSFLKYHRQRQLVANSRLKTKGKKSGQYSKYSLVLHSKLS